MKRLIKYLKGYGFTFTLAVVAIIIATALQLTSPVLMKYAIDSIIGDEPAGALQWMMDLFGPSMMSVVGLLLVVSLVRGVFLFLKGYFSNLAAEKIAEDMRNKLYAHIQKMTYSEHSRCETGDMVQRCTSDVETVRRFIGVQIVDLGRIVFMILISLGIMLSLSVKLTLYSMIMIPILFIFSYIFFLKVQKTFKTSDEAEGALTTVLQENLSGVRVVKAFGRQDYEIEKFDKVNENHRRVTLKMMEILSLFWSSSDLLSLIQNGIVLVVGSYMVITGEITIGILVAFITYVSMLLWPVKQLGRLLSELGKATVAIDRIEEVLAKVVEVDSEDEGEPQIHGDIVFENVSYAYDQSQPALHNVSFHLKAGQTLGIMGSTGAGKSTLVHLIQRLFDYEGSIKIDGVELKNIKKSWIRKQIGLILQEPYLYSKNVKENIRVTHPDYSDHQVESAAKSASIHDNILTFKDGYNTIVGEKGVSLSGGQKQRLAISRTIIDENKKVLIFDDSLSAVDTDTDRKIRDALKNQAKDITTIIISHRIATISEADLILVLDEGRVVQKGTHETLVVEKGLYKRIWDLQKQAV